MYASATCFCHLILFFTIHKYRSSLFGLTIGYIPHENTLQFFHPFVLLVDVLKLQAFKY